MGEIKQKIAYLQGLAEGLGVGEDSRGGQVLNGMLEVLDVMATHIDEMEQNQQELEDYIVDIDDNLTEIEDDLYEDDSYASGIPQTEGWWEVTCPECGTILEISDDTFDEDDQIDLICPNCGNLIHDNDSDLQTDEEPEEIQDRL